MSNLPSVEILREKLAADEVQVPAGPLRVDCYGDSPSLSESLLALIISGKKRA